MTLSFMNNKGYIFIVRRLGKQSKLILSRLDSISNLKLNLRIHGPCGPDAHAGADLQVFLIFCFKPILLSAHKLILLIYGDNSPAAAPPEKGSTEVGLPDPRPHCRPRSPRSLPTGGGRLPLPLGEFHRSTAPLRADLPNSRLPGRLLPMV